MTLRLYLQIYAALLAIVLLFGIAAAAAWLVAGRPPRCDLLRALSAMASDLLPASDRPPAETEAALRRLSAGGPGHGTAPADGRLIAAAGGDVPPPRRELVGELTWVAGAVSPSVWTTDAGWSPGAAGVHAWAASSALLGSAAVVAWRRTRWPAASPAAWSGCSSASTRWPGGT